MSKFGTIRTVCLCLVAAGLVIQMVNMYSNQYRQQLCLTKRSQLQQDQSSERFDQVDVVKDKPPSSDSEALPQWNYNWDLKFAGTSQNQIADRTLILIRHGQYDMNTGKLTELGRRQADLTGRRLKEMNLTYESITHSTLDRATETAQIIHGHLPNVPIGKDDMLVEGGPIPPNPTISYWKLPDSDYFKDGPRLEAAFRKYVFRPGADHKTTTHEILVAHGNIFRFFSLRALQLPRDAWMRVFIAHASITMLHLRGDGTVSMTKFGDAGHFPHNEVTY